MPAQPTALPVRADGQQLLELETRGEELHCELGTRRYRVRGLERNQSTQQLRVNLLAARDELLHVDTLDLYQARARTSFIKAASAELYVEEAVIKQDLGRLLLALEQRQQEQVEAATKARSKPVELTPGRREAALELLRDPQLVERILSDYQVCGLVGEETNKLLCYLACTSRQLAQPLAVLIQSSSAAGKTSLMDATLAFMPEEEQIRYSALTGQSLYYMGQDDLKHKILAVAEEEGVVQASYALKLLQSDGRLQIAVAAKSSGSGRQQTESYEVEGPVMMLLTTTSPAPDEELANRCMVLQVNESRGQTAAIHRRQRAAYTREGQEAMQTREATRQLHQDAQRLLTSLPVVIPGVEQLQFRDDQTRWRREHAKYLSLIAASALLHQYQRTHRGDDAPRPYIEAAPADIELAGRLMAEVLAQSLSGLLPQTRQLLQLLHEWVQAQCVSTQQPRSALRFTQRQLREALGWGDFQLRRHLARLVELEYVLVYRAGRGNQRAYELACDGLTVSPDCLDIHPPEVRNDHLELQNDHLAGQNERKTSRKRVQNDARPNCGKHKASSSLGGKPITGGP